MTEKQKLLGDIHKLHTTPLGVERIKKNLNLENGDVVLWCKNFVQNPESIVLRKGKNWYVQIDKTIITINAHSFTLITAHKKN